MYLLTTKIEISASPETVKSKFLDFPALPTYHQNGFFKSITPDNPNKPVEIGDYYNAQIALGPLRSVIIESSPTVFRWEPSGKIPAWVFTGRHAWRFKPSTSTPGGTTLVHEEEFSGILSFVLGENFIARMIGLTATTRSGFEGFNRDLKAFCEGTTGGQNEQRVY